MRKARSMHSPEYRLLATKLREMRQKAGFTQRALAERLAKPQSYIHKTETCERELNVIELMDYCSALEIDFLNLMDELQTAIIRMRGSGKPQ